MKSLLLCGIIYAFLFSGCALTGVNWIHSPHAQTGSGVRYFHVHGGATPHSPPDTWRMILEDSTRVDIYARTISQKTCWGGIGLPVFPLFWLPRESGYPDSATSLLLYLVINSPSGADPAIQEALLSSGGQVYRPDQIFASHQQPGQVIWTVRFPLPGAETEAFDLHGIVLKTGETSMLLPTIHFEKVKQRWRFLGP